MPSVGALVKLLLSLRRESCVALAVLWQFEGAAVVDVSLDDARDHTDTFAGYLL